MPIKCFVPTYLSNNKKLKAEWKLIIFDNFL